MEVLNNESSRIAATHGRSVAAIFPKEFRHQAVFNARLRTTGGRYLLKSHNIEMNPKYLENFGLAYFIGIMKHELCHYHLHLEKKAISIAIKISVSY